MPLTPYNPKAKCPKCGHDKISSLHQEAGEGFYLHDFHRKDDERIDRTCQRCSFDWSEAPIKSKRQAA